MTPNRRDLLTIASALALAPSTSAAAACCPIVELRQYTTRPGGREVLIELFERELWETQEAVGIRLIGTFRDLDDPNRFVWLRGFPDMAARATALDAFYTGTPWRTHRSAANATIADSDNVLLLHPTAPDAGLPDAHDGDDGLVVAEIRYLDRARAAVFQTFAAEAIAPRQTAAGGRILGTFASETSPNSFPRLPVREADTAHVTFLGFADAAAHRAYQRALAAGPDWRDGAPEDLLPQFWRKPEVVRLSPTKRSPLRS